MPVIGKIIVAMLVTQRLGVVMLYPPTMYVFELLRYFLIRF